MPNLLKTVKVKNGHQHIVYLLDDGSGVTSITKGHTHMLVEGVIEPGEDGHTHEYDEYVPVQPKKEEKEADIVDAVLECYKEASDLEEVSRRSGHEAEDMYAHKQWDAEKKQELEGKSRAAITVNVIEPKLDNLSGYQRQNRTELRYIPVEGGDQKAADILNYVTKDITEYCFYQREKTKTFDDACIAGRGLFNLYADYEKSIEGDVIIERFPWDEVKFGPHEKEDLSDLDYLIKEKWFSIAKLKQMYPEKARLLNPEPKETETTGTVRSEDWDKRHSESKVGSVASDLVNILKKQYKLLECWRKEYSRVFILVNANDDFVFNADGWTTEDINAVKAMPGFRSIPRVTYRMRVSKVASDVLLEDDYPELPVNDYGIIPVYAKKRKNEFWGKIEGVKDLQLVINKSFSQFVDILNRMAAYGWFYDDQTFPDKKEEEKFKRNSSTPGFTQKVSNVSARPVKEEGVKWPDELVNAISIFNTTLREIMNINLELIGQAQGDSGIAMRQKIIQQLLGNDFIFDNMSFAEKKLGRMLIGYIKKLYTPERIWRILVTQSYRDKGTPLSIGGRGIAVTPEDAQAALQQNQEQQTPLPFTKEDIIEFLQTVDLERHDVVVTESAVSPSAMMSNFLALLELAGKGVQIPPDIFIEFAPIPQKEKVLSRIQQSMQQQMEMENRKYDTEIAKAQIAAQNKAREANPLGGPPQV